MLVIVAWRHSPSPRDCGDGSRQVLVVLGNDCSDDGVESCHHPFAFRNVVVVAVANTGRNFSFVVIVVVAVGYCLLANRSLHQRPQPSLLLIPYNHVECTYTTK